MADQTANFGIHYPLQKPHNALEARRFLDEIDSYLNRNIPRDSKLPITYRAWGDSNTLAALVTKGYVQLVGEARGITWVNNGVGLTMVADSGNLIYTQTPSVDEMYSVSYGTNDEREYLATAFRPDADPTILRPYYKQAIMAVVAWLAGKRTPASDTTTITYSGSWSSATGHHNNIGRKTSAAGATATWKTVGRVVYVGYPVMDNGDGQFSITIDGVNMGTFNNYEACSMFTRSNINNPVISGIVFTANPSTDVLSSAGHALVNGDIVLLSNSGGGLPAPLVAATTYWVRDVVAGVSFKLAATKGGTAIDITTAGTGTQSANKIAGYGPKMQRFAGLSDGTHTVVFTQVAGTAYLDWVGGRIDNISTSVYVIGVGRQSANGYSHNGGDDATVAKYNSSLKEALASLSSDGIEACLVEIAATDGTLQVLDNIDNVADSNINTSIYDVWYGDAPTGFGIHWTQLGQQKLANALLKAMSPWVTARLRQALSSFGYSSSSLIDPGRMLIVGAPGLITESSLIYEAAGKLGINVPYGTALADVVVLNADMGCFGKLYNGASANSAGLEFGVTEVGVTTISGLSGISLRSSAAGVGGQTERFFIENDGKLLSNVRTTTLVGTDGLIAVAGIHGYPADVTKFLNGNGAWTVPGGTGITALTGDVTASGSGSVVATLANIPTATPAAGTIIHANIAAPSSPSAGKVSVYSDSTDLRFHDKNASGVIGTTVVADAGAANNFLTAISAAGAISKAQPSFSGLSGVTQVTDVAYAGGNFTASAGAWTVDSGDQTAFWYEIHGDLMTVGFYLSTTTTSTTPNILKIAIPASKSASRRTSCPILWTNRTANTDNIGGADVAVSGTVIQLYASATGISNWPALTNTLYIIGQIIFPIN